MEDLFRSDGKLMEILDKISNVVILNFLCIVGCLPIVTIGASVTATYSVAMKLVKSEEGYIVKDYISNFKKEFKMSTTIWVMVMIVTGILAVDFYIASIVNNHLVSNVLKFTFTTIAIVVLFMTTYVFPIVAKFENTLKNNIINAINMSIQNLPYTAIMVFINIIPLIAIMIFASSFGAVIFFYVSFGIGMNICLNSLILNKVFNKYIKNN